jgi:ATP-dependent Zn protease
VAYHDAGHAVAIVKLGGELRHVTTVPEGPCAGRVRYTMPGSTGHELIERKIIVNLSGAAAEHLIDLDFADGGSDRDLDRVIDLALAIRPERHLRQFTSGMIVRALDLIARNRREVGLVARALLRKRELSGSEVRALIEKPTKTEKQYG